MASKYLEIGEIREGKEGGLYMKLTKAANLKEGANVFIDTPQSKIESFLEKGYIDEAEAERRIANIPEWKRYVLTVKKESLVD